MSAFRVLLEGPIYCYADFGADWEIERQPRMWP